MDLLWFFSYHWDSSYLNAIIMFMFLPSIKWQCDINQLFCDSFLVQHGHSSLMTACQEGHLEVVQYLVAVEADLNTQNNVSDRFVLIYFGVDVYINKRIHTRQWFSALINFESRLFPVTLYLANSLPWYFCLFFVKRMVGMSLWLHVMEDT